MTTITASCGLCKLLPRPKVDMALKRMRWMLDCAWERLKCVLWTVFNTENSLNLWFQAVGKPSNILGPTLVIAPSSTVFYFIFCFFFIKKIFIISHNSQLFDKFIMNISLPSLLPLFVYHAARNSSKREWEYFSNSIHGRRRLGKSFEIKIRKFHEPKKGKRKTQTLHFDYPTK